MKMMKRIMVRLFLVMVLVMSIFLVSCIKTESSKLISEEKLCSIDSDCVAASCCHATAAVNAKYAPDCEGMLCTMNCEPETLDCGQREIKCVDNECIVVIP